jgi:sugar lactone lactonase YvrE
MQPRLPALVLALVVCSAAARAQDWTNLGGNAARNGLSPTVGPTSASLLWTNATDPAVIAWHPVVHEGRVFAIRESGFPQNGGPANDALVAYDLDTGAELWRTTLPWGGNTSTQWIAWIAGARDGRVYACRAENGKPNPIHAYDAASGAPIWTSAATTTQFAYDGVVFAPDGDLVVGDFSSVVRIESQDGSTVWSVPRVRSVSGNCGAAITASAVFVDWAVVGGQRIKKLDLATGALLYESPTMSGFTEQNAPFLSPDGTTVYFSRTQNNAAVDFLYAFEDTGTALVQKWSRPVRWTTSHEHGVAADGSIYTFLPSDELVRLDPATGNVLASSGVLAPLGSPNLSPKTVVDADGTVYVSNGWANTPATNGRIWAFSADLATNHFTLTLNSQNQGGPSLGRDGTLVVADRTSVRAYRAPTTPHVRFCAGDGSSGACPCANQGLPGRGCDNSAGTGGGLLTASGAASLSGDTFLLSSNHLLASVTSVVLQGDAAVGALPFGDGLRCAGGNLRRLYVLAAQQGVVVAPTGALPAVSVRSAQLGDAIPASSTRVYQTYYRDPDLAFCAAPQGDSWNVTSAVSVVWQP